MFSIYFGIVINGCYELTKRITAAARGPLSRHVQQMCSDITATFHAPYTWSSSSQLFKVGSSLDDTQTPPYYKSNCVNVSRQKAQYSFDCETTY
jgi:hypothetical protein